MSQSSAAKAGASSRPLTRDAAPDVIVTESGRKVTQLVFHPSLFLDKTTVIYGPTRTGKTVIVKNIMKTINGFCDEILVVAPTEPSNRSYEGYVDPPLVHYRLWLADPKNPKKDDGVKGSLRFLEFVWERQEMKAAIYTRANNLTTLSKLFARIPSKERADGNKYLSLLAKKRAHVIERVAEQYADDRGKLTDRKKEANDKFKQMVILIYKKYIVPFAEHILGQDDLTENERYSLIYISFNPRLVIIFDDCAAQLKPLFQKEIFRKLFYQNRHSFISAVICCQDDTDMAVNLKKNAFTSIFAESIVASSFFERVTNKFPKPTKMFVQELLPELFKGHRKLAYIRDDDNRKNFYYTDVPYQPPFKFGSNAVQELCEKVRATGPVFDKENQFYDRFKL